MSLAYIDVATQGGPVSVLAEVDGEWAIHPVYGLSGYRITHVPTGMHLGQVADGLEIEDALRVLRRLAAARAAVEIESHVVSLDRPVERRVVGVHALVSLVAEALDPDVPPLEAL